MSRIIEFSDGFTSSVEPTSSNIPASTITVTPEGNITTEDVQSALEELDSKKADLVAGKVPVEQIPAIAVTSVSLVADIAARDALTVEEGDVAKVLDDGFGNNATYIYDGSSWQLMQSDAALALHQGETSTHGVSGDIVGTSDAQILSNKDFDGGTASNSSRLTVPKNTLTNLQALSRKEGTLVYSTDQQKAYVDNGSSLIPVGSGSGGGSLNYIENPDAETDTTGWATYADAAGTQPVDGTGGTSNITWTRSTSSPLRGDGSFLLTKDAVDRQGQGASYAFAIDSADQAKVMQIGFDYAVASGTYATGDVAIYIVDVTNSTVIQPSAYQVENVGVNSTARLTFQTASNSTSYRLCFHVASTSASAYSLKFDNIQLGPQVVPLGAPVTDWVSYTPTVSGLGSAGSASGYPKGLWRRAGDSVHVRIQWLSNSSAGSGTAPVTFSIPSGMVIDTAKLASVASSDSYAGTAFVYNVNTASQADGVWSVRPETTTALSLSRPANATTNLRGDAIAARPVAVNIDFILPIVGWSSSTVVSSSADTRVVAWAGRSSAGTSIGTSVTTIPFATTDFDTHGAYSSGTYTVKVPGKYEIEATYLFASASWTAGSTADLRIMIDGSTARASQWQASRTATQEVPSLHVKHTINLAAGQTIQFAGAQSETGSGRTLITSATYNFAAITLVQGPSQIAMSEIIACRYTSDAAQSIANTGFHIVNFEDKTYDTHNAVTTGASWKFTAPAPGKYEVSVTINYSTQTYAVGNNADVTIYKNGSLYSFGPTWDAQAAVSMQASNSYTDDVELNAGEYIDIRVSNGRTAGATALAAGGVQVSIKRLGGVL